MTCSINFLISSQKLEFAELPAAFLDLNKYPAKSTEQELIQFFLAYKEIR